MNDNLFSHVNIDPAHTHIPDGTEPDAQKACDDFEAIVKNCGGTDLQLLGLGHNGHIGFNEPAEDFPKFTHCVDLTESTIQANAVSSTNRKMFLHRLILWESAPLCVQNGFC